MIKSVKFRIYPNKKQQEFIDHTLECYRIVYNKGLEFRTKTLKSKHKAGFIETSALITKLKKTKKFAFLKKADAVALIQAMKDLDTLIDTLHSDDAEVYQLRGTLRMDRDDKIGALNDMRKALDLNPKLLEKLNGEFKTTEKGHC